MGAFPEMQESGSGLHFVHKVFARLHRHRDLSRLPYTYDLQSAYFRVASTEYRSARLRLNLRYGLFDLQSADVFRFFIRKLRLAWIVGFVFFNEEYLIARVDFIVALRRTRGQRRWTLRSPSPLSSGL